MGVRTAGILAIAAAAAGAIVPLPAPWVEAYYSRGVFPVLQPMMTSASNLVPIPLLDLFILGAIAAVGLAVWSVLRAPRGGRARVFARRAWQSAAVGGAAYVAFLAVWGANYRRQPITASLDFDDGRVTAAAVVSLNDAAIVELGRLRPQLPLQLDHWPGRDRIAADLQPALAEGTRLLGLPGPVQAGRPKTSVLDFYLTRSGVSGMTGPFFLETIVASNLLPFEQPAVLAHEWGHLAGLAREADASFFGLVVCLRGGTAARYSAWLDIYLQTLQARDRAGRREVQSRLPALVREDIEAMARRSARDEVREVRLFAWRAYDAYLRSHRVASGVRNYGDVVRLLAGTRFDAAWRPALRPGR